MAAVPRPKVFMSWPSFKVESRRRERPVLFADEVWRMPREEVGEERGEERRADARFKD